MTSQNQTSTPYLMGTACAGLFTFGVMTSFLGATLPELSARSGFDLARSGTLFSFLYLPQVPMVFLAGPLIDRFGKKLVLAAGFLCSAAALVGMAYAPSYAVLGALLVMLGLGGSSAMAAANTLIPDLYPAESLFRAQFGRHLLWRGSGLLSLAGGADGSTPGACGYLVVHCPAGRPGGRGGAGADVSARQHGGRIRLGSGDVGGG